MCPKLRAYRVYEMAEDSNGWVFDSLICFLHGPIWNAPLQTFIEEKCVSKLQQISLNKIEIRSS